MEDAHSREAGRGFGLRMRVLSPGSGLRERTELRMRVEKGVARVGDWVGETWLVWE